MSATNLLWEIRLGSKVPTPVYHEGRLILIDQNGIAACVEAASGKVVYNKKRIPVKGSGEKIYASPVLADGKLYLASREDGVLVVSAGPAFKELARNRFDDPSVFNATAAVAPGRILFRSDRALYCVGK